MTYLDYWWWHEQIPTDILPNFLLQQPSLWWKSTILKNNLKSENDPKEKDNPKNEDNPQIEDNPQHEDNLNKEDNS